jgi:hypothetical protein
MIAGTLVTLIPTRRAIKPRRPGVNRWQLHGSIPLAGAGLALGAISYSGGRSHATHQVIYAVASTLLLVALLYAVVGATTAMRQQG